MGIVLTIHSLLRWVIVLVALVAAVKFALGWARKANPETLRVDRALMSAFSGLIDLQTLLGIVFLFATGFSTPRVEHAITMIVAAIVAHLPMAWKKNATATALRNNLFVIIAVMVLVILGVASLGGNRWF